MGKTFFNSRKIPTNYVAIRYLAESMLARVVQQSERQEYLLYVNYVRESDLAINKTQCSYCNIKGLGES